MAFTNITPSAKPSKRQFLSTTGCVMVFRHEQLKVKAHRHADLEKAASLCVI